MTTAVGVMSLEPFREWLATGERGISSNAIVEHLTGFSVGGGYGRHDHPYDPADFRRCELLLRAVPAARMALETMRSRSWVWAALVDHWDEIVALIEEEAPDAFTRGRGSAPKAYALMRELREAESGRASRNRRPEED